MTFNAPLFLFFFLPVALVAFLLAKHRGRTWLLLAASLAFYAWGAPLYAPMIVLLVALNFWLGHKLARQPERRWPLTTGVAANIGLLAFFKIAVRYWPQMLSLAVSLTGWAIPETAAAYLQKAFVFPMGLSFLAFQGTAYLLDIRKNPENAAVSLKECLVYLLLFPKLLAGPIVRYREIAPQLRAPAVTAAQVAGGARRFIAGLAKKALIADQLARLTDGGIFAQASPNLTTGMAWLALLAYTLQIYHDFSGYTDMAVGMGQMFGLRFPENFNHPYISRSISEFWRRWHITLSSWFRDYVFYPLERKRRGAGGLRQAANILVVFLLTGLWHGATANFLLWGGLHGLAIAFENTPTGKKLGNIWPPLQHFYALLVVLTGWVFFRSPSLPYALGYLRTLAGFPAGNGLLPYSILPPLEGPFWLALAAGAALALPLQGVFKPLEEKLAGAWSGGLGIALDAGRIGLLWVSLIALAGLSYQPYIYGGF